MLRKCSTYLNLKLCTLLALFWYDRGPRQFIQPREITLEKTFDATHKA